MGDVEMIRSLKIEFVCGVCLHAVYGTNTDLPPLCPRGHGRMEADSAEPHPGVTEARRRVAAERGRRSRAKAA